MALATKINLNYGPNLNSFKVRSELTMCLKIQQWVHCVYGTAFV